MNRILLAGATVLLLSGCTSFVTPADAADSSGGDAVSVSDTSGTDWQDCARQWQRSAQDLAVEAQLQQEAFGHAKDALDELVNNQDVEAATSDINAATASEQQVGDKADAITAEVPGDECKQ